MTGPEWKMTMWTTGENFSRLEDTRHEDHAPADWDRNERQARRERRLLFAEAVRAELLGLLRDLRDDTTDGLWDWSDPAVWETFQDHVQERLSDMAAVRSRYRAGLPDPRGPAVEDVPEGA